MPSRRASVWFEPLDQCLPHGGRRVRHDGVLVAESHLVQELSRTGFRQWGRETGARNHSKMRPGLPPLLVCLDVLRDFSLSTRR